MGVDLATTPSPSAAVQRAGVERGDPLALRNLLTVSEQIEAGQRVGATHLAPSAARAVEPVAEDAGRFAAAERGELPASAGEDSAAMEHERQSRLRRWQTVGSQR